MKQNEPLDIARLLAQKRRTDSAATPPSFQDFLQYKAKAEAIAALPKANPFFTFVIPSLSAAALCAVLAIVLIRPAPYRSVPLADKEFANASVRSGNGTIRVSSGVKRACIANSRVGVLSLSNDSSIAITPASGNSGERIAIEKGTCAFAVLPQKKPLTVHTSIAGHAVTVTVVGTRFIVESTAASVSVTLDAGTVAVTSSSNGIVLAAGERIVIDEKNYSALFGTAPLQEKARFIAASASSTGFFTPETETLPEMPRGQKPPAAPVSGNDWSVPLAQTPRAVTAVSSDIAALVYDDGTVETVTRDSRRSIALPAPISSRPCVYDRGFTYIIVNANDDTTYMIDAAHMRIAGSLPTGTLRNSGILQSGDRFIAVNSDGWLIMFSLYRIVHRERILDMNFSDIAIHNGTLYAVSPSGTVVCYDTVQRTVNWKRQFPGRFIEAHITADAAGATVAADSSFRVNRDGTMGAAADDAPRSDAVNEAGFFVKEGMLYRTRK